MCFRSNYTLCYTIYSTGIVCIMYIYMYMYMYIVYTNHVSFLYSHICALARSPIPFPIGPPQILFPHTNQFFRALARRDRTHGSNPADRAHIINIIINLGCSCRRPKTTNPNCRNKSGGPHRGLVKKKPKRITKLHIEIWHSERAAY